jgi:tetratricopeptide (TPR) repeat protein
MEQHGVGLLCQLTKLDEDTREGLWTRLLNEFGRCVLCRRLIEDNQRAAAFRVAKGIEGGSERARLLVDVAQAQAKEGEISAAAETAGCIDVANSRAAALSAIAVCLAGRGDLDGARRTADQVEDPGSLVRARVAIARAEGDLGLEQEAQASIAAAEQSARGIRDAGFRALGFCNIAVIQADRGELAQARDLFSAALETARSGQDRPTHQLVLTRIAEALVEAGEAQSAVVVALESDRLSRGALSKLGGKAQKMLESGKYWTSAPQRIATALAKRGDFAFALRAAENITPDWVRVFALGKIGTEQANHGDTAAAQATFEMATETASEMPDSLRRATALNAISLSQLEAGDTPAARQSFAEAMREVTAPGDVSNKRQTEETLTQIVGAQAEAAQTALAVEAAEQISEPRDRVSVLVGVARARFRAGAPEDASLCFEAAEKAARSIADEESRGSALLDIAAAEEDPGKQLTEADNLRIALQVPHRADFSYWRDEAVTAIVTAQAGIGDITGAIGTIERVAEFSNSASDDAWAAIVVAQAKSGDAYGATQAVSRIKGWRQCSVALEAAIALAEANGLEAAGQVLELASQLAKSDEDPYSLCGIAERQVKIGEVEAARRSLTTALSVARNDEATLKAIAIGQAKAGAINAVLMLAGRISHTEHRAHALAGIAVVQAQAGVPEAALQTALRIRVSDRTKPLCDIALAQAKQGEAQLALSSLEAALRNAHSIENAGARTKALLEVAGAQAAMGQTEAAVETLTAAALAGCAIDWPWSRAYTLREVAVAQAQAGDAGGAIDTVRSLQQDEEISPISDRAFFLNQALQALCEAQATAGDTQAALHSARSLEHWLEQLRAIVGIAVVRAKADDAQSTRACFEDALEIVPPDVAGSDRDSARRSLAEAQAEAGECLRGHEFFDLSLENARRIESPKDRADALRRLAEAQANTGETDAARESFSAALESARRIEYYSRANPLGEIAVAQARAGDVRAAVESVLGFDISEGSRAKILCEIALNAADADEGEEALTVADTFLTERNRRLPELAARFAVANDRQHFKRLLIPCSYYTDAAYVMCGLLAKLYPQESTGLAEVFVRAINA